MVWLQVSMAVAFFFALVGALGFWSVRHGRRGWAQLSAERGWTFDPKPRDSISEVIPGSTIPAEARLSNLMIGQWKGAHVRIVRCLLPGSSDRPSAWYIAVQLPGQGPDLPKFRLSLGWSSFIGSMSMGQVWPGGEDLRPVTLESIEFSERFDVRSASERLAADVCSPEMILHVLPVADDRPHDYHWMIEIEGRWLMLVLADQNRVLTPERLDEELGFLSGFARRLPLSVVGDGESAP